MSNKVEPKSVEELKAMHTGSLMSRRKALFKCDESLEYSDKTVNSNYGLIEFKDSPEWKRAYKDLKQVLSTRENLPNKKERKAIRQATAKRCR